MSDSDDGLLGAGRIRELAAELGLHPTKTLGQNFVIDANTVRRIARLAQVNTTDVVLEVGPGLGSLTLALLAHASQVLAVEIDPLLARRLPATVAQQRGDLIGRLEVIPADALQVRELPAEPTSLVANLPYNISVPVLLHVLGAFPSVRQAVVMVQQEVADRLVAPPGSRVYGAPSAKLAWYGVAEGAGTVARSVFWPVPNVDSGLVRWQRGEPPGAGVSRQEVFAVIDAAFSQRRKMLRTALAGWAGSRARAVECLSRAGVDPAARGESLGISQFAAIAAAAAGLD